MLYKTYLASRPQSMTESNLTRDCTALRHIIESINKCLKKFKLLRTTWNHSKIQNQVSLNFFVMKHVNRSKLKKISLLMVWSDWLLLFITIDSWVILIEAVQWIWIRQMQNFLFREHYVSKISSQNPKPKSMNFWSPFLTQFEIIFGRNCIGFLTKFSIYINFKETWAEYVARLEPHERQELEFILRKRRRDFDENISLDPKNAMRNKPPNWVRVGCPGV